MTATLHDFFARHAVRRARAAPSRVVEIYQGIWESDPRRPGEPLPASLSSAANENPRAIAPRQARLALRNAGYSPIPLKGKIPEGEAWQTKTATNPAEITMWEKVWPYATNTGCLCRTV